MLATHILACTGLAGSMVDVLRGTEEDVQNTHRHDSADGHFFLHTHLQLDDPRKGDDPDDEVIQHVEDARCQEESVHVDAFAACRAQLRPEICDGLARIAHGHPNDDRVGECQESAEQQCNFQYRLQGREESPVEAKNGESGAGAGGGVDEGIGE
ncbi:hypothetical protein BO82DRAFT_350595 [Aspergillus uvarum CBS 121591]|uniref:Uncharacterized protein n=1 Tax=Aspergillus uvarum CBS 121591 TaxID=1448315 RepID=A0A319DCH8_9EURO|nr:hypothetical protein BO82DRAFT_350595 [Aspergillus uvarum CBS 121591]PYH85778.1 hypothetical protein BO82DRAFT_350595 [Aspergillus uvarum CBS 121591]